MKKIIVLVVLCMFAIASPVLAADRWLFLASSSDPIKSAVYLDTQRINSYGKKEDPYLNCWMKWETDEYTVKEHILIRARNINYMIKEGTLIEKDGKTHSYNKESEGWKDPLPDSMMEMAVKNSLQWAGDHGY